MCPNIFMNSMKSWKNILSIQALSICSKLHSDDNARLAGLSILNHFTASSACHSCCICIKMQYIFIKIKYTGFTNHLEAV